MNAKPTYDELANKVQELTRENETLRFRLHAFDSLYASMVEGVCIHEIIYDENGKAIDYKILDINPAYESITSIKRQDAEGRLASELYGADEPPYIDLYADVARTGEPVFFDTYFPPMDKHFSISVFSPGKNQFATIFFDITARKKAEEELEKLFTLSLDMICIADINTATFIKVNPAFTRTLGFSEAELLEKPFLDFTHPDDLSPTIQVIEKNLKKGQNAINFENRYICKDGSYRWLSWVSHPVPEKGITYAVAHDITERKKAELVLKESENRFRSIIENTDAGYFFIDKEGIIRDVNHSWVRMYQYASADEIIGRHFTVIQKADDVEQAKVFVDSIMNGDTRFLSGEFSRKCNDGRVGYHSFSARPVIKMEEVIGIEGFIIDITERKKLENQLQQSHKMEAIGTLAGGIAHDFNNILGIIMGNTELALDDVPEWNPAFLNLQEIKTASFRAKEVVKQLLSFSRQTEQKKKPVKIHAIVQESLKLLRASIPVTVDIRKAIPNDSDTIMADPIQIHQILLNLCTNAAHAMEEKGGTLDVRLDTIDLAKEKTTELHELPPGRYIKLSIMDNGLGIEPEIKGRVFDPYFTTRPLGKGTGMGLSIVHGIVKNHHGAISIYSEPGKGTCANVFLPVTKDAHLSDQKEPEDVPSGHETILFIDDEPSISAVGKQILERLGYHVKAMTNPEEALSLFRKTPKKYHLVITDMTMPQLTGDRLAEEIIAISPSTPIILSTGFSDRINDERATQIGIRRYIEKPLNRKELAIAVREAIDGKKYGLSKDQKV
ncbi:MAG: PAS domain S-box protein [Proteobacteria bacterium]|nr:PAS domain S-box protein [Pseudomonadota bacterium]